jgi:hypothetical protein
MSRLPALIIGFDREDHARHQRFQRAGAAVVQHLRFFMETRADAVAAELAHHAEPSVFGKALDGVADVAQPRAGPAP